MTLKILVLHFVDGIPQLGARMSIANGEAHANGGARAAKSIRRAPGGYVVDWAGAGGGNPGLYFVPDAQIRCCEVKEEEAATDAHPLTQGDNGRGVAAVFLDGALEHALPVREKKKPGPKPKAKPPGAAAPQAPISSKPLPPGMIWKDGHYERENPTPPVDVEGLPDVKEGEAVATVTFGGRRAGPAPSGKA